MTAKLEHVVETLRAHAEEFRARGVTNMAVFGSLARGGADADSDVDLVIDYGESDKFSLLDLIGVGQMSEDLLGISVDVVTRPGLRPKFAEEVSRDSVDVF